MTTGVPRGAIAFRALYASALGDYLRDRGESALRQAYELGRTAVIRQLSVLDLAVIHQESVRSALAETPDVFEVRQLTAAADDFFLEALSNFEMVQRGLAEARQALLLARRRTDLSRRLSGFLADASLALDASESLEEMLQLVAEQARELLGAECCVATVALGASLRAAEAASHPEHGRWPALVRWLDLSAIYGLLRLSGGSARFEGEQLAELPPFRTVLPERPLQGWLAASLTALDGAELGAIQAFREDGGFSRDDEAAIVHLAQMASAAVERAHLYRTR